MLTQPPQVDWLNVLTCFASLGIFFVEILITSCQGRPWTVMPLKQRRGKTSIYLTYFAQVRRRHYHTCPVVVVFFQQFTFPLIRSRAIHGLEGKTDELPSETKGAWSFSSCAVRAKESEEGRKRRTFTKHRKIWFGAFRDEEKSRVKEYTHPVLFVQIVPQREEFFAGESLRWLPIRNE